MNFAAYMGSMNGPTGSGSAPSSPRSTRSATTYNAPNTNRLGWMNGQFFDLKAPETGTYTLNSFTDPSHSARAIRLQDGDTTFWIELWAKTGLNLLADNQGLPGYYPGVATLLVHRETGDRTTQLLNMALNGHPSNIGYAGLPEGATWANPLGNATITLERRIDPFGPSPTAVVKIGTQLTQRTPNVIGMEVRQAEEAAEAAGLRPAGIEGVPDHYCANIGRVLEQRPYPGEMVRPGTPMRFYVGERPEHECF